MPFKIVRDDITKIKADAIVNTANPDVAIGDGVDYAIYEAAGRDALLAEREKIGVLEPGEVGVTPAFNLNAKYIIHVSSPWWGGGDEGEPELLRKCYDKSLLEAAERGCNSIAYPLLATGSYRFPKELGIKIATDAFKDFLEEHEMEITLVVFGEEAFRISGELFEDVDSFISDRYVEEAESDEYARDWYIEGSIFKKSDMAGASKLSAPAAQAMQMSGEAAMPMMSLEDTLKSMYKDSFGEHLQQLINKKGLKNSEVYAAANMSKQYFSKLLKDKVNPSKEKMLALAVGLHLNMDETVDFLRLAGYAMSPISQTDAVVEYFIRKQEYNVMRIDIVLYEYGLDPLS
ncbi:macro domain-containing protein [Butyrivibrio sp. INlla16]|uniref:macro domain-containing protein n=1 Tax=Butyrivibrio sp. INlla16 TaxID=1520807 RepID=UPI000880BFAD|nr:macro domain-containing protein [Butyrivibrio sp. INlla16]SDB57549.1 O-acetyl-ADP-ribose deacetylase (regulator of RNase III), contains Macro domain [Butyrivibrio sp. INlla16]